MSPIERHFIDRTNAVRARHERQTVTPGARVSGRAERHARQMARAGSLSHSNLAETMKGVDYVRAGEIVGSGKSVWSLVRAFMHSGTHRRVLLGKGYSRIGVGSVVRDGTVWVSIVFWQPA